MDNEKTLIEAEVERQLELLKTIEAGTKEWDVVSKSIATLQNSKVSEDSAWYKFNLDQAKMDQDHADKENDLRIRAKELETKEKELSMQNNNEKVKNAIGIAGLALTGVCFILGTNMQCTGTYTNKLLPNVVKGFKFS